MGNLAIDQVSAGQNQKEVTINDATDQLDRALTDRLDVDMSGGDVTLTNEQFRRSFGFLANGLSAPQTLTVPAIQRPFTVVNLSATHVVTVERGSTSFDVQPNGSALFYTDGSTDGMQLLGFVTTFYDIGSFAPGKPPDGDAFLRYVFIREVTFGTNFPLSRAIAAVAAASTAQFDIRRNGVSVGTFEFAAGSDTATFSSASAVTFLPGDEMVIVSPSPQDADLTDVSLNLAGVI